MRGLKNGQSSDIERQGRGETRLADRELIAFHVRGKLLLDE